jgi:hypothetical protein
MVVAVKSVLDYSNTGRAAVVVLIGFVVQWVVYWILLFLILTPMLITGAYPR